MHTHTPGHPPTHRGRYNNGYMTGDIDQSYSEMQSEWESSLELPEETGLSAAEGRELMMDVLNVSMRVEGV